MTELLVLLWCVYFADCFVRVDAREWTFRGWGLGACRGFRGPELALAGGRLQFVRYPLWPGAVGLGAAGECLDLQAARQRVADAQRHVKWLQSAAAGLFGTLLPTLSWLVWTGRFYPMAWVWAATAASALSATWVLYIRAHRALHGRAPAAGVWVPLAFSPVSVIRTPFLVGRAVCADLPPIAVAGAVCGDDEFLRVARLCHYDEAACRSGIERIVADRGLTARFDERPSADPNVFGWFCPRCHEVYRKSASTCVDCLGVPLLSLNEPCPRRGVADVVSG